MTRLSASANRTASALAHVEYRAFVDLDFVSGHVRCCSGDHAYTIDGYTYTALGNLANIGAVKENATLAPESLELTLSGVDSSLITTTLAEKYFGRSAVVYIGYVGTDGALVDTPFQLWEGRMNVLTIKAGQGTSTVSIVCENRLMLFNKASGWLLTTEHQAYLMGIEDNIFDQTNTTDKALKWVNKSQTFLLPGIQR